MLGKLFGVEEAKAELQEAREEIQVLEHKLQIKKNPSNNLKMLLRYWKRILNHCLMKMTN